MKTITSFILLFIFILEKIKYVCGGGPGGVRYKFGYFLKY